MRKKIIKVHGSRSKSLIWCGQVQIQKLSPKLDTEIKSK
uniref:Uncharacterized protein n=1 Tax=Rhizophora mucronata TaxID=61149 RepID=A0A2P2P4M8_RHIMU